MCRPDPIEDRIVQIKKSNKADAIFIDTVVDFIRIYADRTHHGKEEDILFRECVKKKMSPQDTRIMNELIEEHRYGRKLVGELVDVKMKYLKGEDTLGAIVDTLTSLTWFYPKHIEKEDAVFFPDSEKYFTEKEQNHMLDEFWEFDRKMIHEKYKSVVIGLKN